MSSKGTADFEELENNFNAAMVSNDVRRIESCISSDWCLVTPEVGPVSRERILSVIASGVLSHDSMTKRIVRTQVYGDIAVVTSRGQNSGIYNGAPISADEWITNIYRYADGEWRCVLTHLTPAH